jgi:glucosamine 6-phosphate synthetase-like amidotransferase/phosphosugar isomerase protein
MCGLTGILIGKTYGENELKQVKELFTRTLLAHEERGREATGVIAFRPDGTFFMVKEPLPAGEFIKTSGYRDFLKRWDKNICTLLGHTRKPTKGSRWNHDNNHPVMAGEIVGIHNGTIDNDDSLFEKENLERKAQVDSEVIFSLLKNIPFDIYPHQSAFSAEIQACTRKLTGSFTTLSVNRKDPRKLLLLKYNQPMSYHYSKNLDTLFFTSRYIFLRKAFGRSVVTEALPGRTAYIFDLFTNSVPRGQPICQFPISSADDTYKESRRKN